MPRFNLSARARCVSVAAAHAAPQAAVFVNKRRTLLLPVIHIPGRYWLALKGQLYFYGKLSKPARFHDKYLRNTDNIISCILTSLLMLLNPILTDSSRL